MYKKLMFLISLVCLLGMASSLSAADLEVDWPDVYTVSGVEEYGDMDISGKVIVPLGATLIMNDESDLDGNGDDGEGGDGASIIVYGTFIMHNRLNMGCDHDAYLIIDGGIVEHDGDKVTVPDNDGGEHRIIILNGGSMVAEEIEIIHDRDAKVILGCNASIEVCNTDEDDSRDPAQWLSDGDLLCHVSCTAGVMTVTDLGGYCAEAICLIVPPEAWAPKPKDGAVQQKVGVVLTWKAGCYVGAKGRHLIFFGDDEAAIEAIPVGNTGSPYYRGFAYEGSESFDPADAALTLDLWKSYFWRIDEFNKEPDPPEPITKGNVWSFTTGCELMPGDINLDCLVNFEDYAMMADDWGVEVFFPDDVTP